MDMPICIAIIICLVTLLYVYGTWTHGIFKRLGIPYRTPVLPCLGTLPQLLSQSVAEYDTQQKTLFPGKISGAFLGRLPILEVSDANFVYHVTTKEFSKFRNRRHILPGEKFANHVFFISDDHWKHVRHSIAPVFSTGKLKQMFELISNCADRLVEHVSRSLTAPLSIQDFTSSFTADVIAITAFGMDVDAQNCKDHPFIGHAESMLGIPRSKGLMYSLKRARNAMILLLLSNPIKRLLNQLFGWCFLDTESCNYFEDVITNVLVELQENKDSINMKRNRNFITMVSDKLVDLNKVDQSTIHVSGEEKITWTTAGLTREDVYSNAVVFIAAGLDTTSTALQFVLYILTIHADIQEKVYQSIINIATDGNFSYEQIQQLDYLDRCVKETLRLFPPVFRTDRVCCEDTVVNDIPVPKGMVVLTLIYAIHHDPDYWPEPEKFDPERFLPENYSEVQQRAFLPFGAGGRMCMASRLVFVEVKIAVVKLLSRFRFIRTDRTPEHKDLKFLFGMDFLKLQVPVELQAVSRTTSL